MTMAKIVNRLSDWRQTIPQEDAAAKVCPETRKMLDEELDAVAGGECSTVWIRMAALPAGHGEE